MTPPICVLELRTVRGTGGGPEKTILLGTARTDPSQFAITVCYIRDARDSVFNIADKARELGVDYSEVVERHSFDPTIWPRLCRLVRDHAIDIVHAHDYKTDLLAWLLSRRLHLRALATVHGWTGQSARERWLYYPADRRILSFFPRLIAVSSDVKEALVRAGARPENIATILNGIDASLFRRNPARQRTVRAALGLADDALVVGAVGRLEPQKRFDVLLEAFATLRATLPRARLVIAGDGSLRAALSARVAALNLSESCHLLGYRADVADLHHAFDLFVQSSEYEGTPNAVLEAMAMETPIVATNAGGTAEMARHAREGLIVISGDPNPLVAAMRRTIQEPEATAVRVLAARRRVETELSFDARMRAVEEVYVDLVQPQHRARASSALAART